MYFTKKLTEQATSMILYMPIEHFRQGTLNDFRLRK